MPWHGFTKNTFNAKYPNFKTVQSGSLHTVDVMWCQWALNQFFTGKTRTGVFIPRLLVDGDFGTATDWTVRRFQMLVRAYNGTGSVALDGIVGPVTWKWISHYLNRGTMP